MRRATGERSVGHLGTLDPMATGVLPLLLGKYTRLAQFFATAEKSYEGTIRFGFATDTFDAEGTPAAAPVDPALTLDELRTACRALPRRHAAAPARLLRQKNRRRPRPQTRPRRQPVEVKPARIHIADSISLARPRSNSPASPCRSPPAATSAPSRMSSASSPAAGAHLATLRRTQAGPFTLAQAIPLDELKSLAGEPAEIERVYPTHAPCCPICPSVTVDEQNAGRLRNGMQVNLPDFSQAPLVKVFTAARTRASPSASPARSCSQPSSSAELLLQHRPDQCVHILGDDTALPFAVA